MSGNRRGHFAGRSWRVLLITVMLLCASLEVKAQTYNELLQTIKGTTVEVVTINDMWYTGVLYSVLTDCIVLITQDGICSIQLKQIILVRNKREYKGE